MDRIYLGLVAFFGGLLVDVFGWLNSGEKFDPRKFGASAIKLFIAAAGFAAAYEVTGPLSVQAYIFAFLAGTGFDNVVTQVAGWLGNSHFPIPSKAKPFMGQPPAVISTPDHTPFHEG